MRDTNITRLEGWLGPAKIAEMRRNMSGWYGPGIAMAQVPGSVFATKDGFVGPCLAGGHASFFDWAEDRMRKLLAHLRVSTVARDQMNAGFATLTALRQAHKGAQLFPMTWINVGVVGGNNTSAMTIWSNNMVNKIPVVTNLAASAAPGGRVPTSADGGYSPPAPLTGTNWYVGEGYIWSTAQQSVATTPTQPAALLYDRLFDVAKTMSSSGTEAVTGTPSRYTTQSTPKSPTSVCGNFLFIECAGTLSNTAHNWTVCKYTNENGTTGQSMPSAAGIALLSRGYMDHANWFLPLVAGDLGVAALTQMQCSSNALTGTINFVLAHPLTWLPFVDNMFIMRGTGGIASAVSLVQVQPNACLTMLVPPQKANQDNDFSAQLYLIGG